MKRVKPPTFEQLVLLVLVREKAATIPELVDRFEKAYVVTSRVLRGLRDAGFAEVTSIRPHTDRHPACHVYSPTKSAIGALKIPFETPLPPKYGAMAQAPIAAPAPAPIPAVAPAQPSAPPARAAVRAPVADIDAPPTTAARPRTRSSSGSGVIAGWITIGRGSKWGSG